jgi:hypothetical protein
MLRSLCYTEKELVDQAVYRNLLDLCAVFASCTCSLRSLVWQKTAIATDLPTPPLRGQANHCHERPQGLSP